MDGRKDGGAGEGRRKVERRVANDPAYTGPERRSGTDRRMGAERRKPAGS
jgi:hypothetical protein